MESLSFLHIFSNSSLANLSLYRHFCSRFKHFPACKGWPSAEPASFYSPLGKSYYRSFIISHCSKTAKTQLTYHKGPGLWVQWNKTVSWWRFYSHRHLSLSLSRTRLTYSFPVKLFLLLQQTGFHSNLPNVPSRSVFLKERNHFAYDLLKHTLCVYLIIQVGLFSNSFRITAWDGLLSVSTWLGRGAQIFGQTVSWTFPRRCFWMWFTSTLVDFE